jgi:hypothetical protein
MSGSEKYCHILIMFKCSLHTYDGLGRLGSVAVENLVGGETVSPLQNGTNNVLQV